MTEDEIVTKLFEIREWANGAIVTLQSDDPSVYASAGGTWWAMGQYTERGIREGKPYFNLIGELPEPTTSAVSWDGFQWIFFDKASQGIYSSDEDVPRPGDATTWAVMQDGIAPAPDVWEGK